VTFAAVPFIGGCETPLMDPDENFGRAVNDNRGAMLGKQTSGAEGDGIEGPSATDIVENYHYNEDAQTQDQQRRYQSGLVETGQ
jgi:hypothetical protein